MKKLFLQILLLISTTLAFSACQADSQPNEQSLKVATYNILYDGKGYKWQERKPHLVQAFKDLQFDVCGAQECDIPQVDYILNNLDASWSVVFNEPKIKRLTRAWAMNNVIFYRNNRLKKISNGTFWFGPNPYPPEKKSDGWGGKGEKQNRFCTWAKFKDKKTKKEFYFFNLHLNSRNEEDRVKSFELLKTEVPKIAGNTPFIIVGDFNTGKKETIQNFVKSGVFNNSQDLSLTAHKGSNATFFGLTPPSKKRLASPPIDYIFVSKNIKVLTHETFDKSINGVRPSDHNPVLIDAIIK